MKTITPGWPRKSGTLAATLLVAAAIAPPAAASRFPTIASILHVSPSGIAVSGCTESSPCDIVSAFRDARPGDEILIGPGHYSVSAPLSIDVLPITIEGVAGSWGYPEIDSSAATVIDLEPESASPTEPRAGIVRRLRLRATGDGDGTTHGALVVQDNANEVPNASLRVEQVFARADGYVGSGCTIGGAVISDSICWATGLDGTGLWATGSCLEQDGGSRTDVVNVTAVGSGSYGTGILDYPHYPGCGLDTYGDVDAGVGDTIARGTTTDAWTFLPPDSNFLPPGQLHAEGIYFDSSAYRPALITTGVYRSDTDVPIAGPVFENQNAGDFRELRFAPTIDAGASGDDSGAQDQNGDPRVQGAAIDIGALESYRLHLSGPRLAPAGGGIVLPHHRVAFELTCAGPKRARCAGTAVLSGTGTRLGSVQFSAKTGQSIQVSFHLPVPLIDRVSHGPVGVRLQLDAAGATRTVHLEVGERRTRLGDPTPPVATIRPVTTAVSLVCPSTAEQQAPLTVTGTISPVPRDAVLVISYDGPAGAEQLKRVSPDSQGHFADTITAPVSGQWTVQAGYTGSLGYGSTSSQACVVTVQPTPPPTPQPSAISISCPASLADGGRLDVSGAISPERDGAPVTVVFTAPDGTSTTYLASIISSGPFKGTYLADTTPQQVGTWLVQASWPGDPSYEPARSNTCSVSVYRIP